MKKHFLLSFLMTLVGIFTMQATNVIINVDKAANVIVSTNSGYGKTLDLVDGINVLDLSDADDSPLLIKAAQGAEITSVVKNESETLSPVAGEYTVRFYNVSVKIDIETTGEGGGSDIVKDITMNFRASGEGVHRKKIQCVSKFVKKRFIRRIKLTFTLNIIIHNSRPAPKISSKIR